MFSPQVGMISIYFVGPYKPIMCGIADYTSFITQRIPFGMWGVLSFDLEKYGVLVTTDPQMAMGHTWYGITDRRSFSAPVIRKGLRELAVNNKNCVLWFQHEFGIWQGSMQFVAMLKNLDMPKVVTFHTLHFQSNETPTGLRREQYDLLQILLPYVDAITVFSYGVYRAVTSAFPEHYQKVHIIKHGVHSYPEISCLSRKEAKEKFNDFLLYESNLDRQIKETLYNQRIFLDPETVVIGQTGFLSPSKGSALLYTVRDRLQKTMPNKRVAAVRIGVPRDKSQEIYAEQLQRAQNGKPNFVLKGWLPQSLLPLAQRAFDVNFYWPIECTQSGILAHALGAGAMVAGRDLEGVGETLKQAGGLADTDFRRLVSKIEEIILNPVLAEIVEKRALSYAAEFSWENQARRHYELAERILHPSLTHLVLHSPVKVDAIPLQVS